MEHHEMAEKLVEKCGISYEEAGDVLKEAGYDMLEAMIILERKGKLGNTPGNKYSTGVVKTTPAYEKKTAADAESLGEFLRLAGAKLGEMLKSFMRYYICISKDGRQLVEFPAFVAVIIACCTAGLAVAAIIILIVCGCSINIRKEN